MEDIHKLRIINKLKSVYRLNSVDERHESVSEHSWSSLILADFFLSLSNKPIDRLKVYELLIYHDVAEIEAKDTPLQPGSNNNDQEERERKAAKIIYKQLPQPINDKFLELFKEFDEQKTIESRFAKAIDAIDPTIHELDHKKDWKGWSKKFLMEKKAHLFEEFPEIKKTFNELLEYMAKNHYFDR